MNFVINFSQPGPVTRRPQLQFIGRGQPLPSLSGERIPALATNLASHFHGQVQGHHGHTPIARPPQNRRNNFPVESPALVKFRAIAQGGFVNPPRQVVIQG